MYTFDEKSSVHGENFSRPGDPYTATVRNVCVSCNNGWMSTLQDQAKPLVHALAMGEKLSLDDAQRFILARWSAMVTINLECYGRMLATTQFQRTALMNGEMPAGWRVSIARMTDTTSAGRSFHRTIGVPIYLGNGEFLGLGSTYYIIERAAFHTLRSRSDQTLNIGIVGAGLSGVNLPTTEIWPSLSIESYCNSSEILENDLDNMQRLFARDDDI